MVQAIRPGQPQTKVTVSSSQPSLFGNGQEGKLSNQPRDPKAEERRAKEKFAQTSAGKAAGQKAVQETIAHVKQASKPKAPAPPPAKPCHYTHPPYPVFEQYTVIGGSGILPHVLDCDVYCSLDHNGASSMPWDIGAIRFVWEIKNYGVPTDVVGFKRMVTYLIEQLKAGKKVHVGCMAGHGRTGMVLAAMRFEMAGDKDAIMHVRDNYCDQAVETDGQIKWLMDHYGMNKAPPRKKKYIDQPKGARFTQGNFQTKTFADPDDDYESTASNEPRDPKQNSWVANSPWLKELEGPTANLAPGETWYADK